LSILFLASFSSFYHTSPFYHPDSKAVMSCFYKNCFFPTYFRFPILCSIATYFEYHLIQYSIIWACFIGYSIKPTHFLTTSCFYAAI